MRSITQLMIVSVVCGVAVFGGCGPAGGNNLNTNDNTNVNQNANDNSSTNTNDNVGGTVDLEVINTGQFADPFGIIRASDRYLVFGGPSDDGATTITKVFDTQSNQTFDLINQDMGYSADFAISGSRVILRGLDNGVYQFDASDPTTAPSRVGSADLALSRGVMDTDGGSIIAFVTDNPVYICWVDLNDSPLVIHTFAESEESFYSNVAVSGTRIAYMDGNAIKLRDTDDNTVNETFDVTASQITAMDFDDDAIVFVDSNTSLVNTLDTSTGQTISTGVNFAGNNIDIQSGTICMFSADQSFSNEGDTVFPSAIGQAGSDQVEQAPDTAMVDAPPLNWGTNCAVSPDGNTVFTTGGLEPLGIGIHDLYAWQNGQPTVEIGFATSEGFTIVSATNVVTGPGLAGMLLFSGQSLPLLGYIDLQ